VDDLVVVRKLRVESGRKELLRVLRVDWTDRSSMERADGK
jgi:hypothetical protein